jgi:hypothetical protein
VSEAWRSSASGAHCDDIEIGCGGTVLALQGTIQLPHPLADIDLESDRRVEAQALPGNCALQRGAKFGSVTYRTAYFPLISLQ